MKILFTVAAVLGIAACGGSSTGVSPTELAAYQRSLLAASSAVTSYQTATQSMATAADCQAAAQQYAAQMGAALQAMHEHSATMDEHMRDIGQAAAADMTCGADVMAQQLHDHVGVACSSGDMAQNRTVAAQHCQQMTADADHLQMRAAGMGATSGTTGSSSGTGTCGGMMGCGEHTCTGTDCMSGGYTATDGHHMSWGEPMHGCTVCGGTYQAACGTTTTPG